MSAHFYVKVVSGSKNLGPGSGFEFTNIHLKGGMRLLSLLLTGLPAIG